MTLPEVLRQKQWTMYRLSKETSIPYSVINNICNNKTKFKNCTVDVAYKIAKCLDVPVEELIQAYLNPTPPKEERMEFERFKSHICHLVKDMRDLNFIIDVLETNSIRKLYDKKWYPETFYLLAMIDYLSRLNQLPLCVEYDDIRNQKLSKPIFSASVVVKAELMKDSETDILEKSKEHAIPEFLRFNIIESEIRSVV